jgi:flagellar protein FlgJ
MGVDRIGGAGKVTRDSASAGFDALQKRSLNESAEKPQRNAKVDEVAKMYEKQFLREMVKAMRGTVSFGAEKPSMGEKIYRDQLDEQYVEAWGDNGGIGLGDVIYEQVMERFFNSAAGDELKRQAEANGGNAKSIPLTDRDVSRVIRMKSGAASAQIPLRVEVKEAGDGRPAKVQAPWAGEILSNSRLEGGKTALTLAHGPHLRSTLVFQGVTAADAIPGKHLARGEAIAVLSPEIHSFLWNLNQTTESALDSGPDSAESNRTY